MRILGVDYGAARIGLALSDPTGLFASGLCVLKRITDDQAAAEIARIAKEKQADEIVIGLPLHMNGSFGEKAQHCQDFAQIVQSQTDAKVVLQDERLTTVAAQRTLLEADVSRKRRREVVDSVAATLMLQTYLDRRRSQLQRQSKE
ncbi:Holliday junction resolvase RuvX [Alicyclobacillus tolerans]|uniref:Holliday junction resolvase RuvX n=1 Tax=Alicyclobacillus tolerans TaxID=90970 RepID=UPI001F023921|nr:Holliday junction resolvase RuvX [Alicyclobacillus tolerans]MCF8563298.1 Holliday junction resolvase RuvX [Alicyclobacillus tolerans]